MELEIQDKKENTLLDRTEVRFTVSHPNQPTPKRESIREQLSADLKIPKDRIIVDHMNSHFGVSQSLGYAKVYKTKEIALQIERKYQLKRNRLIKDEKKKDKETEEAAEAPAKEAPAEEKADKPAKDEAPSDKGGKEKAPKEEAKEE